MNIFILSTDPYDAASLLADVHVNKMLLESCQLLCTAMHLHGAKAVYKPTHVNHPCTKWTAQSSENFNWVLNHGYGLSDEYWNYTHSAALLLQSEVFLHNV